MALLEARNLNLAYDRREIVRDLSLALPIGRITIIVGANGSGKSTLLRGLSRLLPARSGSVTLDGKDIHRMRGKELSRRLGLLPQSPIAPDGVTVRDLVARGRFPHQGLFQQWTSTDEEAVVGALQATGTDELQDRQVGELSGGQRQRVWIAMALAQQTDVLLLDEPTTFLDVTHQLEVLDVVRDLNRQRGTTVGIVLHDLNLAARYADHLIAVREGSVHCQGAPAQVITETMVREVFDLEARVLPDPVVGTPMVLPLGDGKPSQFDDADDEPADDDLADTATDEETSMNATSNPPPVAADVADSTASGEAASPGWAASSDGAAAAPAELSALEHSSMLAFDLEAVARRELGQNLVRLTLASPELEHFGTGTHPLDLRVKLIIPGPSNTADHFARVRPGGTLEPESMNDWYRTWLQIAPEDRGWLRTYTVRAMRSAGHPGNVSEHPEIDIDMVLHVEPDSAPGSGVASRWAQSAVVGDRIDLLGPNRHLVGPDYGGIEFRPGTARTLLLAGDETAAPAICAILEALPESMSGHAVIEVGDRSDVQRVFTRSDVEVTWLVRAECPDVSEEHGRLVDAEVRRLMSQHAETFRSAGGAAEGEGARVRVASSVAEGARTGEGAGASAGADRAVGDEHIADIPAAPASVDHAPSSQELDGAEASVPAAPVAAVEASQELDDVDIDATILWETTVGKGGFYAWLAGEAGVIKGLRRHLVSDLGIDRSQVSFMGYWRKGRPEM